MIENKKILMVVAHPDDEVLGCGATVSRLIKEGYDAFTLILGEGKTSRNGYNNDDLSLLKQETLKANEILGIKQVFFEHLPDNRFDSLDLLDIVKIIEEYKNNIKPDIIFTHHFGDINIDHQITYKAVLTATRPLQNECVKEIYSFEIPSSTEWNSFSSNTAFVPNVFFEIADSLDKKIKAMSEYKSELREYPHPRSLEYINDLAKAWGAKTGTGYAEAFILVRGIK